MLDKMGKCRVARVSEKENGAPSALGLSSESKKVKMIRRQIEMAREQRVGARVDNIRGKKKRGKMTTGKTSIRHEKGVEKS